MTTTATFAVVGMTCDHCVRSVTEELSAIQGVSDVRVDLASGQVEVVSHESIPAEAVEAAVVEAGFTVG